MPDFADRCTGRPRWIGPLLLGTLLMLLPLAPSRAEWRETFESPKTSWRLVGHDTSGMKVKLHERTFHQARSGQGSERLRLQADFGTFVHFGHPIPPSRVIDELAISVWVRSNRPGIQLLASVVLPRTMNPRDGTPLRTILYGGAYEDVGKWQQLVLHSPARLLKQQEASLRFQYGPDLDIREAYVDLVAVNVFGGRGETEVWLDDLELTGNVAVPKSEATLLATAQSPTSLAAPTAELPSHVRTAPVIRVDGSHLLENEHPIFVRMIEHQGESFAWLRSLGFNCIRLHRTPTEEDIAQAREHRLWLVAPCPTLPPSGHQPTPDRLLAWDFGGPLTNIDIESVRDLARRWRQADPNATPLLAGQPAESFDQYRRALDVSIIEPPPPGSSFELQRWSRWLLERQRETSMAQPLIASIPSDPPLAHQLQWQALGNLAPPAVALEPEQLRLMVYHAVAAGVRGIYFRSHSRLDGDDEATLLRARTVELLNAELRVIEPWLAGGKPLDKMEEELSRVRIHGLEVQRGQLYVLLRTADEQQYVVPPFVAQDLHVTLPIRSSSARVYQLQNAGLTALRTDRVAAGVRVHLDELPFVGLLVATHENHVIDHVGRLSAEGRPRRAQLQLEVQQFGLAEALRLSQMRSSLRDEQTDQALKLVARHLDRARQLSASSDYRSAETATDAAANLLARVRRDWWESASRTFVSSAASPFCFNCSTLPLHWALAERAAGGAWSHNAMPAGGMENLRHLIDSGWKREALPGTEQSQRVELSFASPRSGRMCLELTSLPTTAPTPVTLVSAQVPVRAGQLVQIHGWVRIAEPLDPDSDGLLIFDSLGGTALAERIYRTVDWQEFCLYRTATVDQPLRVTFQLTTPGTAWIDDISVRVLDLQ